MTEPAPARTKTEWIAIGVLGWGPTTGILAWAWSVYGEGKPARLRDFLIHLAVFGAMGALWGLLVWWLASRPRKGPAGKG